MGGLGDSRPAYVAGIYGRSSASIMVVVNRAELVPILQRSQVDPKAKPFRWTYDDGRPLNVA
jgi:hypothetical protein